ncbi:hypothetical protein RDWZM_002335 [Blomia tropicalis]|uniref:N-alpha-acetyltransferase 40 n=1 Tax=Blomia tropicalis TaxID=40697 RepID=A0A9Q0MHQ1_BLOTA|nr:N-alpha-acetyltransferase 40 [Blomia tropicalis]KAJ6223790.1 hypothetical protein RDWZM_002335 [Blomia tropicalis]
MTKPKRHSSANATIPYEMLLRLANEKQNPLQKLPDFTKDCLHKNILTVDGDKTLSLNISCHQWRDLSEEVRNWMVDLTENNMKQLYEQSAWGWNRKSKQSELRHDDARHLLVHSTESNQPIAFVHFRFEKGYVSEATLYCYELQVEEQYRHQGIGKCLMGILMELAAQYRMKKVLLTVLKQNTEAMRFYTEGLKFIIDTHSPSKFGDNADYEILSKRIDPQTKK